MFQRHHEVLTGAVQFRLGAFRKLVMQVQVVRHRIDVYGTYLDPATMPEWRDAAVTDLAKLHSLTYSNITIKLPEIPELNDGEALLGSLKPGPKGKH